MLQWDACLKNKSRKFGTQLQNLDIQQKKNINLENEKSLQNSQEVILYQQQIYDYLFQKPQQILGNFINNQKDINEKMRSILMDWLVDVHLKFRLRDETLFLTQFIIDSYLAKNQVNRNQLQLVGVVSMLIACKYEEIYPPQDFINVTDNAYNQQQVIQMESQIILSMNFNFSYTTPLIFLNKFLVDSKLEQKNAHLARYLLELAIIDNKAGNYQPNVLAAGAIYLVNKIRLRQSWNSNYIKISEQQEVKESALYLLSLIQNQEQSQLTSVFRKFNSEKFSFVSKLKLQQQI